jgi:GNAT superfamily N-acetyltransferase
MTPEGAAERLVQILREDILLGTDRELPRDMPLGELGLDSLALVTFLTQAESSLGVDLPDDVWVAREPLTLDGLAALVAAAGATDGPAAPVEEAAQDGRSRSERLQGMLSGAGIVGRLVWPLALRAIRLKRLAFESSRNVVLERRLDGELPPVQAPPGVALRAYERGDEELLAGLWPEFEEERARRRLARALATDAFALVAVEESRILALDLLSAAGEDDIRVSQERRACYGYRLVEAPDARGRRLGLVLLAYSLGVARERGYRSQLTAVETGNLAMLATATHVLGFRPIGTARRVRVAGLARWSWEVDGRRGAGRRLVL